MRSVVLAELRHNGRRAVASALAIGIAVAFVVVTLGATSSMKDFLLRTGAAAQLSSDLVVSTTADPEFGGRAEPVPAQALAKVKAVPGVADAYQEQTVFLSARFSDGDRLVAARALPPPALDWYRLSAGRLPDGPGQVLIDSVTATQRGLRVGDALPVVGPAAPRLTVAGLVKVADLSPVGNGGMLSVVAAPADLAAWAAASRTAASQTGASDSTSSDAGSSDATSSDGGSQAVESGSVFVRAAPGVDVPALRSAVAAALPGLVVLTGQQSSQAVAASLTDGIDVLGTFLLVFAAISLFVAMIVIANTFAIVFAQRTAQLALVRCVGATRRQVFRASLVEALAIAVTASLAGALAGVALVVGGAAVLPRFVPVADGARGVVPWAGLAAAVAVGVVVTLGAALVPARRATRVSPLAALRPDPVPVGRRAGRIRAGIGLVVALLGGGGLTLAAVASTGVERGQGSPLLVLAATVCGFVTMLGVLLAGQVVVPAVARLLGRPLAAVGGGWGPVGRLAVGNTVRNPARASATSMAIFVGVCLVTSMAAGAATALKAVDDKLDVSRPLDVVVSGPQVSSLTAEKLARVTGTVDVTSVQTLVADLGGSPYAFGSGDAQRLTGIYRGPLPLVAGTVLVPPPYDGPAQQSVTRGSVTLRLAVKVWNVQQPLLAAQDFAALGTGRPTPAQAAQEASSRGGTVWVRVGDDVDPQAYVRAVHAITGSASVDGALLERAAVHQIVGVLLEIVTGLLAVALVISVIGVGNTMALSVLERRRETGVQRALGLTRRQLRACLTTEAVLLALTGGVLGVVLGLGFGFAGMKVVLAGTVDVTALAVPWVQVLGIGVGAVTCAVLASVLPGRRAGRVPPTQALAAM